MITTIRRYWRFWFRLAQNSFQETFVNRVTNLLFMTGKAVRLGFSMLFLLAIQHTLTSFGAYTTSQLLIFFVTYQLIDVTSQALFRGVYAFTNSVRRGEFDLALVKPINPLFQALMGIPDANDVLFLLPLITTVGFLIHQAGIEVTLIGALQYGILLFNGLLIATALHILILAFGILTMDVDGIMWLYRDFMYLGQLPVDAYKQPVRTLLSTIIPIGVMITIPAKQLLGLISFGPSLAFFAVGISAVGISVLAWKVALKRYSSASS